MPGYQQIIESIPGGGENSPGRSCWTATGLSIRTQILTPDGPGEPSMPPGRAAEVRFMSAGYRQQPGNSSSNNGRMARESLASKFSLLLARVAQAHR